MTPKKTKKCDHVMRTTDRRVVKGRHGRQYIVTDKKCQKCQEHISYIEEK